MDDEEPPAPYVFGAIFKQKEFWVAQYSFLLSRGYQLRPRYEPNWVPSWTNGGHMKALAEDAIRPLVSGMSCTVYSVPGNSLTSPSG